MHLRERDLVFFDFETTGLNPWRGDRIVEIAAVRARGESVVGVFTTLVNPLRPIPAEVSNVHGITDEQVRDAPTQDEVLPEFVRFFGDDVLLAHNASFDIGFLTSALVDLGLQVPSNLVLDTLAISRKLDPNAEHHSLDALRARYELSVEGFHRAERDARDLHAIFVAFLQQMEACGLHTLGDVLAVHGPALSLDPREVEPDIYPPALYEDLVTATRSQRTVVLVYRSAGALRTVTRRVDPLKIVKLGGHDYLVGFCHIKGEKRNFRLDRIDSWQVTLDGFERVA